VNTPAPPPWPGLAIQYACTDCQDLPEEATLRQWLAEAFAATLADDPELEMTVRFVDASEAQSLNQQYRSAEYVPNVLAFPAELPEGVDLPLLGDVVICAAILREEAAVQGKTLAAHCAHLLIHGALHLLGYDHDEESRALEMEATERLLLAQLGFADPYAEAAEIRTPGSAAVP